MKTPNKKITQVFTSLTGLMTALLLTSCAHHPESTDRSPATVQRTDLVNLKINSYKQQLRTIEGKIIPLHFLQAETGSWYLALGCAPTENQSGHTFEIYNLPYTSPDKLDAHLKTDLIRDSNAFSSISDCTRAFEKVTAATTHKPICLKETQEGVLVSECRPAYRFDRTDRNFGRRF